MSKVVQLKTHNQSVEDYIKSLYHELNEATGVKPYERLRVSAKEMKHLQDMVFEKGLEKAAHHVGISSQTYLRVCAGFSYMLRRSTTHKLRKYLDRAVR